MSHSQQVLLWTVVVLWSMNTPTTVVGEPQAPPLQVPRKWMHDRTVLSMAYSPDGKTLASGSEDKTIKLWDVQSGKELATLRGHTERVLSVAYSPDGKA